MCFHQFCEWIMKTQQFSLSRSLSKRLTAVLFSSRGARGGSHLPRWLVNCPSQTCGCQASVGNVQNPIKARRLLRGDRNQYLKQKGTTHTDCLPGLFLVAGFGRIRGGISSHYINVYSCCLFLLADYAAVGTKFIFRIVKDPRG